MEKYSVLMTIYKKDKEDYFALALDSMLNQTYKPDEIVLVKDGEITAELQKIIDERTELGVPIVQVQLPQNLGLGLALNEGIKVVKNDLIARMDSDDYSMPERCELQVAEFERHPDLDIIGSPVLEFVGTIDNIIGERNVPITNEAIYKFAKRRDPFNHPTVMYRKNAVQSVGGYSDYRKNQDTDLWIKMLLNNAVCMNLTTPVFRFRFDEGTLKKRKTWLNTKLLIDIRLNAWKKGFCSFGDFLIVLIGQLSIYILPTCFQKIIYKKILRKR